MSADVDPCNVGALLREAVEARCRETGETVADVAMAAGIAREQLTRAIGTKTHPPNPNTRPETLRAVCRALTLELVLVERQRKEPNEHVSPLSRIVPRRSQAD